jgi:hypothetical protein
MSGFCREMATLSIAHIDWHAFYATFEKHDCPVLRDQPVIVGASMLFGEDLPHSFRHADAPGAPSMPA